MAANSIRVNAQNNTAVNINVQPASMTMGKVINSFPNTIQPGTNETFLVRITVIVVTYNYSLAHVCLLLGKWTVTNWS